MAGRLRGDDGAATTELVIVAPAFLFMVLLIVQLGLYFHAINVASAAAQDGARDASLQPASLDAGEDTARALLDALAPRLLAGASVSGQFVDGGDSVRMTVSGDVSQVVSIPGVDLGISVNESAETPVEQFRPAGDVPADSTP
ncbi:MAG: pilus assembly protein [Acidimicrobiales bacterium]|nr:pilus assembly protein [Acidimicrobiales bacterium]